MSKLVIFGATGQQGSSILETVHHDPVLSKQYSIRAITRDATSKAATEITNQGIETVQADIDDPTTLPRALAQAHTVILITSTIYDAELKSREYRQTKNVGDAAVAAGATHILWNGRTMDVFDSKAEAEAYLRTLQIKVSLFMPGMFMQNLTTMMAPRLGLDGTYSVASVLDPDTKVPLIDAANDSGMYVAALLGGEEGVGGATLYAATRLYSFSEIVGIISAVSGKVVRYVRLPDEVYAGFMKSEQGGRVVSMMRFFEEVGYFGPGTGDLVEQTRSMVKGRLTTFEEFAEKYMKDLEACA
ncbi:HSCARG dehydrogenase [Aspergillus flavus]|uniref:HSCARG dehydrogenase n=1 Tax=Aspergillus flavus (strain ATCC 200026 / FGSC A1120 / IAM 13836 / NRRL 3357 / JCM 12722 / SRRC 167) TaxID=332952 RepID=A0A7U2R1Y5_ASPFN|nr:HSCARG dehydrogenase [Aspergillus flavus]